LANPAQPNSICIFVDEPTRDDSFDALYAGARAILPRTAKPTKIITAIKGGYNGLAVLPASSSGVLSGASLVGELLTTVTQTAYG